MKNSKKVVWIIDVPGWAYDANVKQISQKLPQYQHQIVYGVQGVNESDLLTADIIVNVLPHYLTHCSQYYRKTIVILDSIRAWSPATFLLFNNMAGIVCCNSQIYQKAKQSTNQY